MKSFHLTPVQVMVIQYIDSKLIQKSKSHRAALKKLGQSSENDALSDKVLLLQQTSQVRGMVCKSRKISHDPSKLIFLVFGLLFFVLTVPR